jgi:hypothetical protein
MANREKGEVALTLGEQTFTLVLNTNAQAEIEAELSRLDGKDRNWDYFVSRMMNEDVAGVREVKMLVWGMSRKYHRNLTLDQVGDLIDEAGGSKGVLLRLWPDAVRSATPDPADVEALGLTKSANPPRPRAKRPRTAGAGFTSSLERPA